METPPDIRALGERVRRFGEAIDADRRAIERLKRGTFPPPGFWVTGDGESWTFYPRPNGRLRPAS